jgi:hypothetical protein
MSDDESSGYESVSEASADNNDDANTNASSKDADDVSKVSISLSDIAISLHQDSNALNLSKEEENLITDSIVNTKKYEKIKNGVENRFFDTIDKYGSPELKKLLVQHTTPFKSDKLFYFLLREKRTEEKRLILSKCLLICALKWRVTTKKKTRKTITTKDNGSKLKIIICHIP